MRIVLEDPDGPGIFHAGEHAAHARFGVQAQARELWLQTENLWVLWPGFIAALRAAQ